MEFHANEGKRVTIEAMGKTWARHAISTHFVGVGESYIDLMERYVKPIYQEGDILSMSEKVIALCQGRVVREEEVRPGFWAKLLSRFVHQTSAGPGMGLPIKMQFAINVCGLPKILWAAFRAAIDKLRGVRGTFYRIAGLEVSGLDGFYGEDIPEYEHMGVRIPVHDRGRQRPQRGNAGPLLQAHRQRRGTAGPDPGQSRRSGPSAHSLCAHPSPGSGLTFPCIFSLNLLYCSPEMERSVSTR